MAWYWYASAVKVTFRCIQSSLILFLIAHIAAQTNSTRPMTKPFTHPDYAKLPETIKQSVTEKEYCWLSDSEKQRMVDEFTMPEATEDG